MKVIQKVSSGSIQLSQNFYLSEYTDSATATRLGIDNSPDPLAALHLFRSAAQLEQVRSLLGNKAIFINSGFRSVALNQATHGSQTSDHLRGEATDFVCRSFGTALQVAEAIRKSNIDFGQLIYEGNWVHISLPVPGKVKQVLTAKFSAGQKTQYLEGIVA
jgi:hypothetical protein